MNGNQSQMKQAGPCLLSNLCKNIHLRNAHRYQPLPNMESFSDSYKNPSISHWLENKLHRHTIIIILYGLGLWNITMEWWNSKNVLASFLWKDDDNYWDW